MTTTLYFVRHAEPNYNNHDDFSRELTNKGLQDSQELVKFFQQIKIDAFFSSPYKRAIDTIAPLAQEKGKTITTIDDLRERKITDYWIEDFTAYTKQQWEDFSYTLEGGESLHQVQERNIVALNNILSDYPDKTLVIGTHGTALSTILNYYQPTFGYEDFQRVKHLFPWIVKLEFQNLTHLSTTEIDYTKKS